MHYLKLEEYIIFTHQTEEQLIQSITANLTSLFHISIQQKLEYPLEALHLLFQNYQIPLKI